MILERIATKRKLIFICIIIVFSIAVIIRIVWSEHIKMTATIAYTNWKKQYVIEIRNSMSRVVNPQDNNVTVSEGMGYGMLFSATVGDHDTFNNLWKYAKQYLDKSGLMDWKIDAGGEVIGNGSASDADQDMAYALLLASRKWNNKEYLNDSLNMMNSIIKHEVSSDGLLMPGDSWGNNMPFNPSYVAPAYYTDFALASKNNHWSKILIVNLQLLSKTIDHNTGLSPDWINFDGTIIENKNEYGYDAIRVPIRLIQYYKKTKDSVAGGILKKEYSYFSKIGSNHLMAGYTVAGRPQVSYINSEYLSSFTAISTFRPYSLFHFDIMNKLINTDANDYYGSSLKVWTLLILSNKL